MADLRLEKLTHIYAGKTPVRAVNEISLTAQSGECVALLGPSGAGKSTILRLIAGLETPTHGDIHLDGISILQTKPAARRISMAFQYPALLPQLSVRENLGLGPKLRRQTNINETVQQIADLLGISTLLARKPETLSGGEQQRVALGRALVSSPRVLLLDEPLAGLDPLSRVHLRDIIREVQKKLKITTFYVTHDQAEAAEVADQIAILQHGNLEQFGTARHLYRNPANLFVCRFFGADRLNTLHARISFDENGWFACVGSLRFPLASVTSQRSNTDLTLAFRPADVQLSKANSPDWKIIEIRDLGWTTLIRLASGAHEIYSRQLSNDSWSVGERVHIHVAPDLLHIFPRF